MTEERRYALLDTAAGRKELRGMLKETMDASPDPHLPKERSRAGNALLDRMGADLIDSTILEITAFKSWFTSAYEGLLDNYPKKQDD
jgi:hypothetical protein